MKCPKCGYISFDYNSRCPKCNKDIALEQGKLNFPPFKPNPPFLLESLIGEATDSAPALQVRHTKDDAMSGHGKSGHNEIEEINLAFESNENQDTGEISLSNNSGPPEFSIDQSNEREISINLDDDQSSGSSNQNQSLDDLSLNFDQPAATGKSFEQDDLSLDLDNLSIEGDEKPMGARTKTASKKSKDNISDLDLTDDELSIDLENLDLDLDLDLDSPNTNK